MQAAAAMVMLSVLFPTKMWFAPDQAWTVNVKAPAPITLVLTDFTGRPIAAQEGVDTSVPGEKTVDVKAMFPSIINPGSYILLAIPKGTADNSKFVGTPIVIGVRDDKRPAAPLGAMVVKMEPLRYAVMTTQEGPMTMAFYYDVAPNTVANFLSLSETGYYNGLTFHRIVPEFVIQGGDPRGDGSGGPGYQIDAEFNERPHHEGVLSMARSGDPNEAAGGAPRSEYANSAGSQFFVCLDYNRTKNLDRKYTAFGKVISGMDVVKKIAAAPLADVNRGKPEKAPVIQKTEVFPVTSDKNPYVELMKTETSVPVQGAP